MKATVYTYTTTTTPNSNNNNDNAITDPLKSVLQTFHT